MYAVIETGGKQYRVAAHDKVSVEKLDVKVGDSISLDKVLLVADGDKISVGKPTLAGAKVTAKVLAQEKSPKVRAEKFKRRGGFYHRVGHRQELTTLQIEAIALA
jgi:large subunit ribosomal protein L21